MKPCISQATTLSTPFEADLPAYARRRLDGGRALADEAGDLPRVAPGRRGPGAARRPGARARRGGRRRGGCCSRAGPSARPHWDHFRRRLDLLQRAGGADSDRRRRLRPRARPRRLRPGRRRRWPRRPSWPGGRASGWPWSSRRRRRFCASLDTTLALIAQCGAEDVGVCLDLFHYYTGPSKFEDLAYLTPENLAWVQVCDLERRPPRAGRRRRPDLARRGRLPDRADPRPPRPDRLRRVRLARSAQPAALADPGRPGGRRRATRRWPAARAAGPPRPRTIAGRVLSVAVAAFQPPAVVYREEQNFDWWVYALVVAGRGRWSGGLALASDQRGHDPAAAVRHDGDRGPARRSPVCVRRCRSCSSSASCG